MRFKEFITESKESREAMKRMNLKYMGYGFYRGNGNTYKWNPQLKRMEQSSSKDYLDRADFQDYRKVHNPVLFGTDSGNYPAGDSGGIRHPFRPISGRFLMFSGMGAG